MRSRTERGKCRSTLTRVAPTPQNHPLHVAFIYLVKLSTPFFLTDKPNRVTKAPSRLTIPTAINSSSEQKKPA
ncbi:MULTISPECIES: hypothetical protein [unclassified Providencia]|uniref:hypothetical protein n=1 Tax=Providencia TaxID=586 RepID=UPI00234A0FC2|nr:MULTISPECIES: hypothetical protein [unclassified Providencia]